MGIPPLAIANQYQDQQTNEVKRARYRLILVRGSDLRWLNRDRLQEVQAGLAAQHKWIPVQNLPFTEVVLYAYAADRTPFPTYVCLPSGLCKARTGQVVAQTGPEQEILSLPGIYFFDGWRVYPTLPILTPAVCEFKIAWISPAIGRRVAACCKIQARRTRDRGKLTIVPSSSSASTKEEECLCTCG